MTTVAKRKRLAKCNVEPPAPLTPEEQADFDEWVSVSPLKSERARQKHALDAIYAWREVVRMHGITEAGEVRNRHMASQQKVRQRAMEALGVNTVKRTDGAGF